VHTIPFGSRKLNIVIDLALYLKITRSNFNVVTFFTEVMNTSLSIFSNNMQKKLIQFFIFRCEFSNALHFYYTNIDVVLNISQN